jgi:solute carrier family 25 phosphate transporter 3
LKHQLWTEEEEAPCGVGAIDNDSDNPVPALPLIKSKTAVYILSAAIAEGIADVLMCPWEMLKVKIQTAPTPATAMATAAGPASGSSHASSFPTRFGPAFWMMVQQRHQTGWPFGAIVPLWGRQVIGTVANFVTFEHVANLMYDHLLLSTEPSQEYRSPLLPKRTKSDLSQLTQLGVTFTAGYVSGIISTVVSHPADTLVSLQARYPTLTMREIIGRVGIYQLATKGLGLRIVKTGTIIAAQWLIYDSFKSALGMGTTGGGGGNDM